MNRDCTHVCAEEFSGPAQISRRELNPSSGHRPAVRLGAMFAELREEFQDELKRLKEGDGIRDSG